MKRERGGNNDSGIAVHLPWWKWADRSNKLPAIDVAIFNHMIVEIHPNALRYTLVRLIELHQQRVDSSKPLLVFIEGFGHEGLRKAKDIVKIIHEYGFELIENRPSEEMKNNSGDTVTAIFQYEFKKQISSYRIFPKLSVKNKTSFLSSIKCLVKYTIGFPFEMRYQKE